MKNVIYALMFALLFTACSSDKSSTAKVEPKLVLNTSLSDLKLNDQFEKSHSINSDTKKLIFAFSKDMAHTCNDYFATKDDNYLHNNQTQFVADVSSAPSLIRSMFIMPGLKDFKHTVLLLDSKETAAPFKANQDTEKIIVVYLDNLTITSIKTISTEAELISTIENS